MSQTLDKMTAVMQDLYAPMVRQAYQQDTSDWNYFDSGEIPKGEASLKGKRFAMNMTPSASFGYRGERGIIPATDEQEFEELRAGYTRLYLAFGLSTDLVAALENGSMVSGLGGLDRFKARDKMTINWHLSQDVHGNGNGMKAVVKTFSTGAKTITCATETADGDTLGAQRLLRRGRYQAFDPVSGQQRTGGGVNVFVCSGITHPTATAVFNVIPSDLVAGDILVHEDSFNKAIRGMGYGIDDSPKKLHGLSKALYPSLNSTVASANSQPLDFGLMTLLDFVQGYSRQSGSQQRIFSPITQSYAASLLGHPLRRLANDDKTLKVGFDEIEVNGNVWVKSRWALEDRLRYLDKTGVEKLVFEDLKLWDWDGRTVRAETASTGSGYRDGLMGAWTAKLDLAWPGSGQCGELNGLSMAGLPRGYKYAKH